MRSINIGKIKQKLANGNIVLGSHVFCGEPMLTEAIALSGFDIVWIDMEHTAIDKERVQNNLIALQAGGACSLVRLPWNDPVYAKPILDMGPDAIIFPYIRSAVDARNAVAACEYPPMGVRGYGPMRALEYGRLKQTDYVDALYKDMWRMLQIEHIDAVRALDEILDVEGVDAFIVGPNDLSASVGKIGRVNDAEMQPIYDEIARKLVKANRPFGVSMGFSPEVLRRWLERGARILFAGNDVGYVYEGARDVFSGLTDITKEVNRRESV